MKSRNRWHSIVALVILTCMLVVPVSALGKKGKDSYNRGLKYELAQQWEKAAQEFTMAVAADPSNVDYQLHYRRAIFNASQTFMQQGRSLAEARDYVGAYNAFRQAFGYDPVNQLAVSEMERMVRLQEVKEGKPPGNGSDARVSADGAGTPASSSTGRPAETPIATKQEPTRVINFNGDLKQFIRTMADQLNLNVIFDRQSFAQPRSIDVSLRDVTTAKALDYIFLQENLFFQKLDRRTILVADQARRQQYQQLVVRTFYISNSDPEKAKQLITQALPASVGRPQSIVVADKDTNSLTVRDTAENVKLIGDLLQSIDKDRAEVVMDVNIYEVSRSDLLQLGNQLGSGTFNLGGSPGLSVLTANGTTSTGSPGVDLRSIVGLIPTGAAAALVIPPSVLTAFQSRNNSRLLASTQIHAFNNEESTARIGQRVPVQTAQAYPFGVQTGTTTNTQTGFPSGGFPVINYEPTGLTLNFTPQVFPNLDVQVKMKIESKDVSGASTLTPTFTERTITGTARVQNNRTMMLASVTQDVQSNGRQGLPFIGGLPIIGRFFTSPTKDNRQVDIVIAVTPRVLRAPAITPRDEEMRPSGTLTSPTTGSIAILMQETEREEAEIAARSKSKDAPVQLASTQVTYVPATNTSITEQPAANPGQTATSNAAQVVPVAQSNNVAPPQTQTAALVAPAKKDEVAPSMNSATNSATDSAVPQPKALVLNAHAEVPAPQKMDVASALQSIVSPTTSVSGTSASAKQDVNLVPAVEGLAPKSEKSDVGVKPSEPAPSLVQLSLSPDQSEMRVGEKRQIALGVKTGVPLGMAVLTLRFDPRVMKINSVTPGSLFANAKIAPALTQSMDQNGMLLVSLAPAAGSPISGEGVLLNIEFEAVAGGDSLLAFDLANVHLVASDGHNILLQVEPVKLTVK
ncbi:MAG: ral secretion pathway protein [Blastocatellia bacterium]|jgi:general secretion pathway protein D|nr:ral secretion pathway protein [Blastocatellia bacterium]